MVPISKYEGDLANSRVIIHYNDPNDIVKCIFTNARASVDLVGEFVEPVKKLAVLTPWPAIIGMICIGTVVVVVRKHQS